VGAVVVPKFVDDFDFGGGFRGWRNVKRDWVGQGAEGVAIDVEAEFGGEVHE
jgi:hypothetical protein